MARKGKELSSDLKKIIFDLHKNGLGYKLISKRIHKYCKHSCQNQRDINVTAMTGDIGTDDGINILLYYVDYKYHYTLDTENDDFENNMLDVFSLKSASLYLLKCIEVESVTPTTQWIMESISVNDEDQELISYTHNATLNESVLYCKDQASGDVMWTVIVYDEGEPSVNATSIKLIGSNKSEQFYFLSYKEYQENNSSGLEETFNISISDVGRLVAVQLWKYHHFRNIHVILKKETVEYSFHSTSCNVRTITLFDWHCGKSFAQYKSKHI
ncbi:XP_036365101.1uncharacterized protein LOC118766054 [Octopus vulgaris]|uniref:XP_036365101.1uncharacterized protein LOC118766054 n=1 Tax=Octopus vulgaris TaxID=6645 RepID=A0AA36BG47_OCTVU|nr:XP_036365101.1uncharacterized protein LOC118766054 [Octopus vulgaris]